MTKDCFIFRVNYDNAHDWVMNEFFDKGILRQGWGHRGLELIDENKKRIEKNNGQKII